MIRISKVLVCLMFMANFSFASENHYYLAQWDWSTEMPGPCWRAPHYDKVLGMVDLRSLSQCGTAGGSPQGYGFFVYSEEINDIKMTYLGGDLEKNGLNVDKLETSLGININSSILSDVLWEVLTTKADPTGVSRTKPIMPTRKLNLELYMGGLIKTKKLIPQVSAEWSNIQIVLQEDYRKIREETLANVLPDNTHLKVLKVYEEKYKIDYKNFIPNDLPDEKPMMHDTTITESFNTDDGDTLGPDLSWTETAGDWDISSNKAITVTGNALTDARAESDLSSDDHYSQIDVVSFSGTVWSGPTARFNASARTYYVTFPYSANGLQYLRKVVTGTETDIDTAVSITRSLPEAYKVECDGSSIKGYQAGVERLSATNTDISSNLRCGMAGYHAGGSSFTMDNFEASDLEAPPVGGTPQLIVIQY